MSSCRSSSSAVAFAASVVRSQDRVADTGAYVDEAIHEIRTVQAYAHEPEDRHAYGERVEAAFRAGVRRIRQRALLIAAVIFLVFVAVGIILWIGGHDVLAGRLSAGQLASFVFYAVIVATSVGTVSEVAGELQRAAGATERLMEILDTPAEIAAPAESGASARTAAGNGRARRGDLCLSVAPERSGVDRLDA